MRILILHNYYQQAGGEDRVFESEAALLESRGHEVIRFVRRNDEIRTGSASRNFGNALWNQAVARELKRLVEQHKPDIAHVHNVFSVLSPAVYHVLRKAGIPIVQTLHNYRLACPNARLMRNGRPCSLCRGRTVPWPAIWYRCYQSRLSSSIALASVLTLHRLLHTWDRSVDLYLAPSDTVRNQLIPTGIPAGRIVVKPHFVSDPGTKGAHQGGYALFLGRLEPEKGIMELLDAWRLLPALPLRVGGTGPLSAMVQKRLCEPSLGKVSVLGWLSRGQIEEQLADARFLIIPSLGCESFGLTAIEAFSFGVPVLSSGKGALAEIVRDNLNGLTADPCNATELAAQARRLFDDTSIWNRLSLQARADYLSYYSPEVACEALLGAYALAQRYHRISNS